MTVRRHGQDCAFTLASNNQLGFNLYLEEKLVFKQNKNKIFYQTKVKNSF